MTSSSAVLNTTTTTTAKASEWAASDADKSSRTAMAATTIDVRRKPIRNSIRGLPAIPTTTRIQQSDHSRDFWIPQVTQDGQIYYANTLTGKLSRDLPRDPEDDVSDGDLIGLTAFQSSACSRSSLGHRSIHPAIRSHTRGRSAESIIMNGSVEPMHPSSSISPFKLSDTPRSLPVKPLPVPVEPGTALRPRANTDLAPLKRHPSDPQIAHSRNRSDRAMDATSSHFNHQRSTSAESNAFSPSLNAHPLPVVQEALPLDEFTIVSGLPRTASPQSSSRTVRPEFVLPTPDIVSELLQRARQCIHAVVLHLQQFGIPQVAEDEEIVEDLMCATITAIRDLLYVSGPAFRHLGGKSKNDRGDTNASQTPLIPAQRRAVATLSKFVLSARAVLNGGPWIAVDNVSQLSSDADELDRSVVDFVSVARGVRSKGALGSKHLYGYLSASHADPEKAGAGAAGTWKGFGWVNVEDHEEAPRRNLSKATFNEFEIHASRVREMLHTLREALREMQPADVVTTSAQGLFRELSSLVLFLGDIHIARHVDIETVNQAELSDGAQYIRTVEKARIHVRAFEAATQAIYDDGATLLVATQRVRRVEPCEYWKGHDATYDALETMSSSLDSNLKISRRNLGELMRIGVEQSAILERCHRTPVEWRMSQRSLVSAILTNQALEAVYDTHETYDPTENGSDGVLKSVTEDVESLPCSSISPSPPPVPASGKPTMIPNREMPAHILSEDDDLFGSRTPQRPDKIKAFFGDDAPSHYLSTLRAEAKPWYLRPRYNPDEVLIDPDGTVRGGTVPALVERLTAHEYADTNFTRAFLMTFTSFMTLDELFNLLVDRFWIQPPPALDSQELEDWRKHKQSIVRIRVINAMKLIIRDEDLLDKEDSGILDRMAQFVSQDDVFKIVAAKQLLVTIKRAQAGNVKKLTLRSVAPPPAPIVPKRVELLDIDPLELARQLTITESHLYQKIRPSECLQRSKQSRTEYHDGIANIIRRSNRIADWVTYSILCKDEPGRRAAVIKQFIQIADRCRLIQNFSTMMAIVTGLNYSPIHRLKRSWEQVSSRYMSQLETCETLINSYKHYNSYRTSLANVPPPCVPFVGVFLTALTHIQDGSKDFLPGDLVNFRKRQKASEVVQDLQRWQAHPHNFHPLPSVLVFIDESLNQFGDHDATEMFWQLSLEREPREKDEEKLARWLTESGFS